MKKAVLISLPIAVAFSVLSVDAQPTPRPITPKAAAAEGSVCPTVSIQGPTGRTIRDGQSASFIANIAGGDPKTSPLIVWSVSAGTIKEGQGTRKIDVDSTGSGSSIDRQIVVDLWVTGYAPECSLQATATVKIIPPAVKFGEFGEIPADALEVNLKALAQFLAQSQDNLYLIGYAGRKSERGYSLNRIRKMKDALVAEGVVASRIIAMDGGFREDPLFDFWIVASGAEPPRPAPTVNRSEIVYPRTTPPRRP